MTDSPVPSERATREAEKLWRGKDAPLTFHKLALALDRFAEEERYGCVEVAESYGDVEIADAIRSRSNPAGAGGEG